MSYLINSFLFLWKSDCISVIQSVTSIGFILLILVNCIELIGICKFLLFPLNDSCFSFLPKKDYCSIFPLLLNCLLITSLDFQLKSSDVSRGFDGVPVFQVWLRFYFKPLFSPFDRCWRAVYMIFWMLNFNAVYVYDGNQPSISFSDVI